MKWMDKKDIYFPSIFHNPDETTFVSKNAQNGTNNYVTCPILEL